MDLFTLNVNYFTAMTQKTVIFVTVIQLLTCIRSESVTKFCPKCRWDEYCFEDLSACLNCADLPSCGTTFSREKCNLTCPEYLKITLTPTLEPPLITDSSEIGKTPNNIVLVGNTIDDTLPKTTFIGAVTALSILFVICLALLSYCAWDYYKGRRNYSPSQQEETIPLQEIRSSSNSIELESLEMEFINEYINPEQSYIFDQLDECYDGQEDFVNRLARNGGVRQAKINAIYDIQSNKYEARHKVWCEWAKQEKRKFVDINDFEPSRKDRLTEIAKEYCQRIVSKASEPKDDEFDELKCESDISV